MKVLASNSHAHIHELDEQLSMEETFTSSVGTNINYYQP